MTREKRIDWLCRLRSWVWVVPRPNMTVEQKSKCIEALTEVIDDLQTEPFINKPCISEQACHEDKMKVLEKIRAEIESQRKEVSNKSSVYDELQNYYYGLNDGLKDARDILDKYLAESEVK